MNLSRALSLLVIISCGALVALLLFDLLGPASVAKVLASSAFVAVALLNGAMRNAYGRLILLGLLLSWCGDFFLIGITETSFLLGLGAFLLAHIAYIAAFAVHGLNRRWLLLAAIPIFGLALGVSIWLDPYVAPYLTLPVRTYTAVISIMVVTAIGTRGAGGSWLILVGASLFFLSDLSVASMRLVETEWPMYVWGLPLYFAGQLCLALSVSQSRSH